MSEAKKNNLTIGGGIAVVGLIVCAVGWWMRGKAAEVAAWPTAEGKVLSSRVTSKKKRVKSGDSYRRKTMYSAEVTYHFRVGEQGYKSSRIGIFGKSSSSSRSDAESTVRAYPKGGTCTVYYDPDDPNTAYLEPGSGTVGTIVLVVGLLIVLGGGAVAAGLAGDVGRFANDSDDDDDDDRA